MLNQKKTLLFEHDLVKGLIACLFVFVSLFLFDEIIREIKTQNQEKKTKKKKRKKTKKKQPKNTQKTTKKTQKTTKKHKNRNESNRFNKMTWSDLSKCFREIGFSWVSSRR